MPIPDPVQNERSLIGTILVNPRHMAVAVSEGVTADWFTDDALSLMWSALSGAWARGEIESITPQNIQAEAIKLSKAERELRSAETLTVDLLERVIDAGAANPGMTIRQMRNDAIERAARLAIRLGLKNFDSSMSSEEVVLGIRDRLDRVAAGAIAHKKISPRAVWDGILAEYEEAYKMRVDPAGPRNLKWTPGLRMPWPRMTEIMNGLRAGLHVVAARPSVGKTAFAVNLMHFWLSTGTPVLFCSLDMSERETLRRYIAEKSRVSARKAGFSPTLEDLSAMRQAVEEMTSWPLSVVQTYDVDELRTMCMIEKSAGRLGVLVIDYLQLLHARSLGREDAVEYARVSYVSGVLKRIANELQIPVVALAQLNREVTKQESAGRLPGLADLRGSGSIEQDAFTVAILHRDDQTVAKWARGEGVEMAKRLIPGTLDNPAYRYNLGDIDPVWWILCKAQNGPTGKLPFVVRKKYFAWMLGDYSAEPITSESGYGATRKTVVDNSPKFQRVYSDWRHDPIEEVLRRQLALIPATEDVAAPSALAPEQN